MMRCGQCSAVHGGIESVVVVAGMAVTERDLLHVTVRWQAGDRE